MQNATQGNKTEKPRGRLRCAVLLSPKSEVENRNETSNGGRKSGFIQISPSVAGPWTSVRLNYAAPAACWRLGNDVVASEVTVKDGNRYVNIRSLVSICNNTDFELDLRLVSKASSGSIQPQIESSEPGVQIDSAKIQMDEVFETEIYNPTSGWVTYHLNQDKTGGSVSARCNCSNQLFIYLFF